jgi:FkbM family methyltransferase
MNRSNAINKINLSSLSFETGIEHIFTNIFNATTNPFGVQIGAFDGITFDEVQPIIKQLKFPFLFVEPIHYYFEVMKNNLSYSEKNKFDNCAISNEDGTTVMGLYHPAYFYENKPMSQEFCLTGMSSMFPIKNSPPIPATHTVEVKTKTLNTLLVDNNIDTFDTFICDTEGYDFEIFNQVSTKMFDTCLLWKFEIQHLIESETSQMVDKFKSHGYNVYTYHDKYPVYTDAWQSYADHRCHDLLAIKKDILI